MRFSAFCLAGASILLAVGLWASGDPPAKDAPPVENKARDADREAILQSARDFAAAYEKGDAKAVAALWTEGGEYESEDGTTFRSRADIEAAFADHFKGRQPGKVEVVVESIRFPSRDTAIEEGLSRTTEGDALPSSAYYRALHVREDGKWRIALSREWGEAENRMSDLEWLVGTWRGGSKDQEMVLSFTHDKDHPFLVGEFNIKAAGKTASLGTMKIGIDPVSNRFMSWHFDADGGHGQGLWLREGNHWALDSHGIQADGTETAAVNVITRHGKDEIGWRSIDRKLGGQAQPDSAPVKLKRDPVAK